MGIRSGGRRHAEADRTSRPKRGVLWLVVFFTVFVAVSYLTRERGEQLADGPGQESEQIERDDRETATPARSTDESRSSAAPGGNESADEADETSDVGAAPYGSLEEVRPDVWRSPAGLLYEPGSAEGHRLKHLARHLKDDRSRPIHGVFLESMAEVLEQIDQAYRWSQEQDSRATIRQERGRTVIVARFDSPIGYVGGERGEDDDHPQVRRLQLILEDRKVITAYPVE